ncbi:bifunctional 2-C-methyl-D-erythritol 4-phosphate cytidylyltransferase/2-C-methyl-D-erythritol 2,4-cyclodiphosphate synthase [Amaricoccus sp.]|uniref:bifunctional 2-C-methyl-D-erythritol 4-phosphate cytidylyltransferase/2-C-methyl-D-erythritol 2,4-cyclodiphosphate synthase n=1 Tax=Amaricoccus sp. TaxID=1872485 RepID=UPI001B42B337|nr:bifunctional 2-C-methyl-D-erythritol 4-phosphate cytidylyltransferase/2-C-methyl-D-erythritol 2,4-cyclodiphosphate synthase [Amaricoccus sp.]MBP7241363.1 bifunctional 2-C-methyl-D-erythritol 4-phosphate cytidylyltransferase/2-C-methyl-D-erythritol 2,4-cyclodiphosphate synthase [Amaricoccus sp.]
MKVAGLVVAAGRGVRLGGDVPKQYLTLGGETVLARAVRALLAHPAVAAVRVAISPDDAARYARAMEGIDDSRLLPPVPGGADRAASVRAGLEALAPDAPDIVLIHDAARPFLGRDVIDRVLAALDHAPAAFPALPVVDALWRGADGHADEPAPRDGLWRAQTPQGFRFDAILAAHHAHRGPAADDVAVARAAGLEVALVAGDEANYKITDPADMARARLDIGRSAMDVRTGNGFDVHAFGPGDAVTLCGVSLPHSRGLVGHSDADVGMHAVTDAILGALAEGDIGRWFPPSDPQWKGAASAIFLRAAAARATEAGFAITHLDCTLVCEAPKIGPHADAMRAALAMAAGIEPARVSVKATTSERLGFTGREEGIAALATATLVRP